MMWSGVLAFVLGGLTWTLLEYAIHRWLGHDARTRPNVFESEHTQHHAAGDYFAATSKKVVVAVAMLGLLVVPGWWLVGMVRGVAFAAGLASCYGYYEWIHRRAHTHAPLTAYGRWVRKHHFSHHFADPRVNFGVTSPLWDIVFGTHRAAGVIVIPRRLVMPWLVEPGAHQIRSDFSADYAIRGAAAAARQEAA
ncbi:MAG: sterol desaturase family protein [Myxococcales bacterium]|nr:sterol desaturase family protein [Myxococcales bacterium]